MEADLYFQLGTVHGKLYHLDSSMYFYGQAMSLAIANGWRLMQIGILNGLGNVARIQGGNQLAMKYFHSALEKTSNSDKKEDLLWNAKLLGNLAGVYYDLSD